MKFKNLLFIMLLAIGSFTSLAQETGTDVEKVLTRTCTDPGDMIRTGTSSDFTTSTAQAYYWTVTGVAVSSGSRTSKNFNVYCTRNGSYTVRLVRFVNGRCIEYCQTFTCGTPNNCPTANDIFINVAESGNGFCSDFQVGIPSSYNIDHIDWDWAISGYSGDYTSYGTTTPLYQIPSQDWTGYYLVIGATVTLSDGTVCDRIWKNKLLDCGEGVGTPIGAKAILYPNPSKGNFSVNNIEGQDVIGVDIKTTTGNVIKKIASNFNQKIDLSDQNDGLYFVTISFKDGSKDVQKLILKK